jgi:glutathione S-transferase
MSELILHHFDASPFAEKIRLVFGFKQLAWRSVTIPMVMPKPDLTALTGGYRKTPVLQIGCDVYCDTQLIARELERRHPTPALFPTEVEAMSLALSLWADQEFFRAGAFLSMATNAQIPDSVLKDRQAFFDFMDFSDSAMRIPQAEAELARHLALLDNLLKQNGPFFLGENFCWADILAYFPVWMVQGNLASAAERLAPYPQLQDWLIRVAEVGHGQCTELMATEALAIAASSRSEWPSEMRTRFSLPVNLGDPLAVTPDDYGAVSVEGCLHYLDDERIVLHREDPSAGRTKVHFPRRGFKVDRLAR